jgi:heptosyltransferase-2
VTGTRYLIVRLAALGDVAMTSTLPREIKRREPGAHVTWLCGARVEELVRLFDAVDNVVAVDELALLKGGTAARYAAVAALWRSLAMQRFDVTLLGHADGRYRALLLPVRTGRLRSLEHRPSPGMLPIPGRYFGDECVRLLDDVDSRGPILGHYPLADVRKRLPDVLDARAVGVVLVPGGTRNVLRESALRRWPVERYRAVAEGLLATGTPVTLVGDRMDAWVRRTFAGLPVRDEIGAHGLTGTLALLAHAQLVITHDTGPLHLAQLVRAQVLALFGPTNPAQFVSRDAGVTVLWGGADLACRPCYDGREFAACRDNLCMQEISVDQVLHRALEMNPTTTHDPDHATSRGGRSERL